jgi:hypothetical protein
VTNQTPVASSAETPTRRGWRKWDAGTRAAVVSTVVAIIGLPFTILAVRFAGDEPRGGASASPTRAATPTGPVATSTSTSTTGPTAGFTYLNDKAVAPQAGGDRLVELPRELRGRAEYAVHPLAVKCPSNQTGDQASEVTFPLSGHYLHFEATVRPYYPPSADQRSATYVYVVKGMPQPDGTLAIREAGEQLLAAPTAPTAVTAEIAGAQEMTIRIRCGDPDGTIVLTDARLTPTD